MGIFGVVNESYVEVLRINSDYSKKIEEQSRGKTKKILDFTNDEDLKKCLGFKPRHYFVNY